MDIIEKIRLEKDIKEAKGRIKYYEKSLKELDKRWVELNKKKNTWTELQKESMNILNQSRTELCELIITTELKIKEMEEVN